MRLAACVLGACLLSALPGPAAGDERRAYFDRIDLDGDGRISLAEFQAHMSRGFRAMDRNGDGILQDHELPPGVTLRPNQPRTLEALLRNLERTFHRMDRDGDGYLSPSELAAPPPGP